MRTLQNKSGSIPTNQEVPSAQLFSESHAALRLNTTPHANTHDNVRHPPSLRERSLVGG